MNRTTRKPESTRMEAALYMSLELGASEWKLAFAVEPGQKPRLRQVVAGDLNGLMLEIERGRQRFDLPEPAVPTGEDRPVGCGETAVFVDPVRSRGEESVRGGACADRCAGG